MLIINNNFQGRDIISISTNRQKNKFYFTKKIIFAVILDFFSWSF